MYQRSRNVRTKAGFRSGFEERVFANAESNGRELDYEPSDSTLYYTKPAKKSRYLPDFRLPNGVLVEGKGRLTAEDRAKMLNVKRDNPEADIRFLFQRGNKRITKSRNSMTYEEWAEKHGFLWAIGENIPEEWYYD